jgi:hypothetical protein
MLRRYYQKMCLYRMGEWESVVDVPGRGTFDDQKLAAGSY